MTAGHQVAVSQNDRATYRSVPCLRQRSCTDIVVIDMLLTLLTPSELGPTLTLSSLTCSWHSAEAIAISGGAHQKTPLTLFITDMLLTVATTTPSPNERPTNIVVIDSLLNVGLKPIDIVVINIVLNVGLNPTDIVHWHLTERGTKAYWHCCHWHLTERGTKTYWHCRHWHFTERGTKANCLFRFPYKNYLCPNAVHMMLSREERDAYAVSSPNTGCRILGVCLASANVETRNKHTYLLCLMAIYLSLNNYHDGVSVFLTSGLFSRVPSQSSRAACHHWTQRSPTRKEKKSLHC